MLEPPRRDTDDFRPAGVGGAPARLVRLRETTMAIELWIGGGGHWFVDTDLGGVQVAAIYQNQDGIWDVEVNDDILTASDLEEATRIFVENYDQLKVQLGPMSDQGELVDAEFQIIRVS